jgi:invasion protein IalB
MSRLVARIAAIAAALCLAGHAAASDDPAALSFARLPWMKLCDKTRGAKPVCYVSAEASEPADVASLAGVAIIEPQGEGRKILRLTFPLGMQLVHGTRMIVDTNPPQRSPYRSCSLVGCVSDYEIGPDLIDIMKGGQTLFVQAIDGSGQPVTASLPLADFAAVYDGPPATANGINTQRRRLLLWQDESAQPRFRPRRIGE